MLGTVNASYFTTNAFLPDYLNSRGLGDWISAALTGLNAGQLPASALLLDVRQPAANCTSGPTSSAGFCCTFAIGGIVFGSGPVVVLSTTLIGFFAAGILVLTLALPPLLAPPDDVHRVTAAMFTISYSCAVIVPVISGLAWDIDRHWRICLRPDRGLRHCIGGPGTGDQARAPFGGLRSMRPIPVGAKGTYTLRVTPAHLANQFKDAALPQVFATPMMVTAMENAALNAVRDYLDPGESAVGTVVNIRHLAATPVGHQVTAQAEVTKVDGRRIEFNVSARDEIEEIGSGTHERMVVDLARLGARLAAKKAPEAGLSAQKQTAGRRPAVADLEAARIYCAALVAILGCA